MRKGTVDGEARGQRSRTRPTSFKVLRFSSSSRVSLPVRPTDSGTEDAQTRSKPHSPPVVTGGFSELPGQVGRTGPGRPVLQRNTGPRGQRGQGPGQRKLQQVGPLPEGCASQISALTGQQGAADVPTRAPQLGVRCWRVGPGKRRVTMRSPGGPLKPPTGRLQPSAGQCVRGRAQRAPRLAPPLTPPPGSAASCSLPLLQAARPVPLPPSRACPPPLPGMDAFLSVSAPSLLT